MVLTLQRRCDRWSVTLPSNTCCGAIMKMPFPVHLATMSARCLNLQPTRTSSTALFQTPNTVCATLRLAQFAPTKTITCQSSPQEFTQKGVATMKRPNMQSMLLSWTRDSTNKPRKISSRRPSKNAGRSRKRPLRPRVWARIQSRQGRQDPSRTPQGTQSETGAKEVTAFKCLLTTPLISTNLHPQSGKIDCASYMVYNPNGDIKDYNPGLHRMSHSLAF